MEKEKIAYRLKEMIVVAAICGFLWYMIVFPILGLCAEYEYPAMRCYYAAWLFFLWLSGVPCYVVLLQGWEIANHIKNGKAFSAETAKNLKIASGVTLGDSLFFLVGNVYYLYKSASFLIVAGISLFVVFGGILIAGAFEILSILVKKAAELQEQYNLTI